MLIKLSFYLAMFVPAVLCGLGEISRLWLMLSVVSAWFWSIWLVSGHGSHDYQDMRGRQFDAADNTVLKNTFIRWIAIFVIYGAIRIIRG